MTVSRDVRARLWYELLQPPPSPKQPIVQWLVTLLLLILALYLFKRL